jgi:hypothetical protein
MAYPIPFLYRIQPNVPLLVLSCSQTKTDIGEDLARFIELTSGIYLLIFLAIYAFLEHGP